MTGRRRSNIGPKVGGKYKEVGEFDRSVAVNVALRVGIATTNDAFDFL